MKTYKILIIDDDRQLADLIKLNFPTDKFTCRTCNSGQEGLEAIDADRPHLIILDVVMPRMDGWDVLGKIKEKPENAAIPIIMCTGRDSVNDVERSFAMGAQAYIMKPIVFSSLLRKVAAILNIEQLLND